MPVQAPQIVKNYMANAEEILTHAIQHGKFTRRVEGTRNMHQATPGGPISKFSSWFIHVEDPFSDKILILLANFLSKSGYPNPCKTITLGIIYKKK